jgi:rRNA-processing protein FCF1
MLDALGLIEKHRSKGVLVDTNLLVLHLVGKVNKNRISSFKRTQSYNAEDFELLERLLGHFGKLVTTPHVLTQVSDLATLQGKELSAIRALFKIEVEVMEERYDESRELVRDVSFERLGLTDAAITTLCHGNVLVLTSDLDLWNALQKRGVDSLNFNHVRPLGWH